MTKRPVTRDDILGAFSVEPSHDREILERYLRDYPEQASSLVDLAQQIDLIANSENTELSTEDNALINAAWKRHAVAVQPTSVDILNTLTVDRQREVARSLSIPRQVITAFRDGKILLSSVPKAFLRKFAEALGSTLEDLTASLSVPRLTMAKSYKADDKPFDSGQVTLEQVLIDAGVDVETRSQILDDVA
jgi:hypothetical protein